MDARAEVGQATSLARHSLTISLEWSNVLAETTETVLLFDSLF